ATFTVTQTGNTISVSPTRLNFGGTNTGGVLSPITGEQIVTVSAEASPVPTWSVTTDQPWVKIANSSGSGSGTFKVSIVNPGNVLGASTNVTSTITVTPSNSLSPRTVTV